MKIDISRWGESLALMGKYQDYSIVFSQINSLQKFEQIRLDKSRYVSSRCLFHLCRSPDFHRSYNETSQVLKFETQHDQSLVGLTLIAKPIIHMCMDEGSDEIDKQMRQFQLLETIKVMELRFPMFGKVNPHDVLERLGNVLEPQIVFKTDEKNL